MKKSALRPQAPEAWLDVSMNTSGSAISVPEGFRAGHIGHRPAYCSSRPRRRPTGTGLELAGRLASGARLAGNSPEVRGVLAAYDHHGQVAKRIAETGRTIYLATASGVVAVDAVLFLIHR